MFLLRNIPRHGLLSILSTKQSQGCSTVSSIPTLSSTSTSSTSSVEIKPMLENVELAATILNYDPTDNDGKLLNVTLKDQLIEALHTYKVLIFNVTDKHKMTQTAFKNFFENFAPALKQDGRKQAVGKQAEEVFIVSNIGNDPSPFLSNTSIPWHSDLSYRRRPGSLGALYSVTVPNHGGQTKWACLETAYENNVSTDLKEKIKHLEAVHKHPEAHMNHVEPEMVKHPIVRKHRVTGKSCLFVSEYFTTAIDGDDDDTLLKELISAVTDDESIIYTHHWNQEGGELILYDNTRTNHEREAFIGDRVLWRCQAREEIYIQEGKN